MTNPDLLVLDANLPKVAGFSILKTLREDMGLKELKVIMLSDFNQQQEIKDIAVWRGKIFYKSGKHARRNSQ